MKFKTWRKEFVALVLLGFLLFSFVESKKGIPFESSLLTAKEKAYDDQKQVLVFFGGPDCYECAQLESFISKEETLGHFLSENFRCAQVDVSTFDGRAIRLRYDVSWLPAILVLDSSGKIIRKQEGITTLEDFSSFVKGEKSMGLTRDKPSHLLQAKESSAGGFFLQIGVFSTRNRAEEWVAHLHKKGLQKARLTEWKGGDKTLYRVSLGEDWTEEQALKEKDYLAGLGIESVVKENK
jgi:thioredoxin-related protein